ncbi:hypothetical protein [Streptomyces malaysiensis]
MNGPEHYRQAEGLLNEADHIGREGGDTGELIAAAQVHATLALAAATALIDETPRSDIFSNYRAWQDAAGSPEGDIRNAVH